MRLNEQLTTNIAETAHQVEANYDSVRYFTHIINTSPEPTHIPFTSEQGGSLKYICKSLHDKYIALMKRVSAEILAKPNVPHAMNFIAGMEELSEKGCICCSETPCWAKL